MTAAASRTDPSQPRSADVAGRRRWRMVPAAVAVAVSVSIHLLGWFVLQRTPTAAGPAAGVSRRVALRVELIPARPAPVASVRDTTRTGPASGGRGVGRAAPSTKRLAAVAASRMATRTSADAAGVSHRQREALAGAIADRRESRPGIASGLDFDWRRDLDAIGSRHAAARSPAQAAVGALGASSGGAAARRDTVDARLADGMTHARRADCRRAYSGAGLLALPMLALDAVRDTGCKW
ncbi:hypothetical protein [Burkholderia metallica]|uniref:hypothetical protein n=1 Tax=Burkholderia metallica TaxID=488729 RepID=UPI00158BF118|nr:hypothetical protein [Burkholderia metallica]MCA8023378.1 hypothetical protein [Burkholderia metallica]